MLLDDLLSVEGVVVTAVSSDNDALEALDSGKEFDVVICPAPAIGAKHSLVGKIRKLIDPRVSMVPVICLSHERSLQDKALAYSSGASSYVLRPISPVFLAEHVHDVVRRGHVSPVA